MTKLLRPLLVIGTRPEGIKMAPVVLECLRRPNEISPIILFSGQHTDMLETVADYFRIEPDIRLQVMEPGQSLAKLTAKCLQGLDSVLQEHMPDCVVGQGDTTTAMTAAMAAFLKNIPFVHVEAGLRSGDFAAPFPEEYHRRVASLTTALHCVPTEKSAENLLQENISADKICITGNTVIDALLYTLRRETASEIWPAKHSYLQNRDMVLVTAHRRENHGTGLQQIFAAVRQLAIRFPQVEFVFPMHKNPQVLQAASMLQNYENIHLLEPLPYPEFVWMLHRSKIIISDSGGVQEEAPSLGKPVLVTREVTERPEAWEAGALSLVGTNAVAIEEQAAHLLTNVTAYNAMQIPVNPYGDGFAAERIVTAMLDRFSESHETKLTTRVRLPK